MTSTSPCPKPIDASAFRGRPVGPCVIVIFGATGDLAARKLIPALANLAGDGLVPDEFAVLGVATRPWTDEDFRQHVAGSLDGSQAGTAWPKVRSWLLGRLYYLSGDFHADETYRRLKVRLEEMDRRHGAGGSHVYYLATAPGFFAEVPAQLGRAGLLEEDDQRWQRVIVEKPFGSDWASARQLNRSLAGQLQERQIYRIDHYLGKETVQNILALRFANGIFEPIWRREYIDHVQITAAESLGVEERGRYYDQAGALRDMVPNHLFQLLTLVAMEPPSSFDAQAVRDEQVKVLKAVRPLSLEGVAQTAIRGQYGEGVLDGQRVLPYRAENHVAPQSRTPTFVALELEIESWRWSGVPFYLRTGKRLARRVTEIAIRFKQAPLALFRATSVDHVSDNWLVLRLQPEEGISLSFGAKVPGPSLRLGHVNMEFCYEDYFGRKPQTGYERLLYDAMLGDATLFQRSDMVETSWKIVAPVLEAWDADSPADFPNYAAGTWGPAAADELLVRHGRAWKTC